MIALKWHSPRPDIVDIDEIVKADIEKSIPAGYDPSELMFHTVFLADPDGPIVHVWGVDEDHEYYHCEYDPEPKWVTFDQDGNEVDVSKK